MSYGDGGVEDDAGPGEAASGEPAGGVGEVDTFEGTTPDRNITDQERALNQATERALDQVEIQDSKSSPLAAEYKAYADALAQEGGLNMDTGMNQLFDRGSISNFFFGPKGFNKYRGPMAGGLAGHGGFGESFLEALIYFLTFGAVDVEFSGRDMIGGDFSHGGANQPMGVEYGVPGMMPGMGTLSLLMPETRVSLDSGKTTIGGGLLGAGNMLANAIGTDKDKPFDIVVNDPYDQEGLGRLVAMGNPSGKAPPPDIGDQDDPLSEVSSLSPSQAAATTGVAAAPVDLEKESNVYAGLLGGTPTIEDRNIFGFAAAQGGEVQKFSPGGVAGLMGRRPRFGLGDDIGRYNQQQLDLIRQRELAERFGRDTSDPSEGKLGTLGGLFQPRVTPTSFTSFPRLVDGLGGMLSPRPPFPQQRQPLNPETYYHIHEKGEVDYPNFPKQIQPKSPRRPGKTSITDPIKPQPVPEQKVDPYVQPEFIQQNTNQQIVESVTPATPEAELPVTPVTPVSSPTEAPVVESPAQQINPEEGLSSMMQNKEINISVPSNLTATVEFPEQLTGTINARSGGHVQNYSLGGIAQLLGPAIAGFAGTPLGLVGSAGLGAAAGYGLAGRKRSFSDAIKGAMLGVAGGGLGQVSGAGSAGLGKKGFDFLPGNFGGAANQATTLGSTAGFSGYGGGLEKAFSGLGSLGMDQFKAAAVPLSVGLMGASMTTPAEMPNMAAQPGMQAPKAKTEEERRKLAYRGLSPFTAQSFVPPTIYAAAKGGTVNPNPQAAIREGGLGGMGLLANLFQQVIAERQAEGLPIPFLENQNISEQINTEDQTGIFKVAKGGEVPEKETLEEGSFVVPADVVSNIGDGNTSSGFAKLNSMFGKESSDYALGGPIKGPTGGLDDLRQTTIAGEQAAALSDGEYVVSKGDVMRLGDGSNKKGAEKLYAMMDQVRMSKHGTTKQPESSITLQGLRSMMG